ncbi:LOW QUALITY PROTEIN: EEF1A lysine methyltransferase 1-like [Panonychus citri]|uniref:LOW QUALITY PROTEIN: EEF1A lysine methyltransferase 1-like n=1 Tax=Panonychus citri TaxID=50023 RepID=UPI00230780DC|nr:LOW QUALITY PROTEIN: EEF1A lysine methyltransferase 1-like [Panonychus citri]XP_053207363.1 LOW QUALITY PROTEIN: EEF1A lysine methyltransferase 1-like [Panonychus citri]
MSNLEDDDDPPHLSAESLAALNEFSGTENNQQDDSKSSEDWELSQFWYDEETTQFLADSLIKTINGNGVIGCISCPTVYIKLLSMIKENDKYSDVQVYLLEFDQRFARLGPNFVFYDYRDPLAVKEVLSSSFFDIIVCDPPFLSEECLTKVTETINYLKKEKIILNTGAIQSNLVDKLLQLKPSSTFIPRHKNNLANQFACFSNFPI